MTSVLCRRHFFPLEMLENQGNIRNSKEKVNRAKSVINTLPQAPFSSRNVQQSMNNMRNC